MTNKPNTDKDQTREYWNQNVELWGKLYLQISHSEEHLSAPKWLEFLYHRLITPIEARLMNERYELTMNFIDQYVKKGMTVVDLGCGTGLFTVEMLKRGAKVIATDYAQRALDLTKDAVEKLASNNRNDVKYLLANVTQQVLPPSDIVLAMGITPYVENISDCYKNVLPTTKMLYCLILDPKHWANIIRNYVPALNVRKLHWFDRSLIDKLLLQYNWRLISRQKFSSGYLDLAISNSNRTIE